MISAQDLLKYEQIAIELKNIKKEELVLRNKIVKAFSYEKIEGVEKKSIEGGDIEIQVKLVLNRKIDPDILGEVWEELTERQQDIIKFKPEISVSKYKKLLEEEGIGKLTEAITEKPGQASIKLKFKD